MTKKQLIIDSALQLFTERGIEATSVQQITEHCGISKGAFYLSFKSKDELVTSIIEHFINNVIIHVDQVVNETKNPHEKLFVYFVQTFTILTEYTSFAEILMRDKISAINEELIKKIQYYVTISNENLANLLFEVFGDQIKGKQFDLVTVINGMVQAYLQWICERKQPVDFTKLSATLVEKTTLLATQSELIFIEQPAEKQTNNLDVPFDQIAQQLASLQEDAINSLEKESLSLLIEELLTIKPRTAIIMGLLANLSHNDKFNWYRYLIKKKIRY
ncbi:TetR/AcrR family transcriptional regulator [Lysinibacillus sp. 2017]|uniref:TetR/AcrR family transcriptional regulator n=1 Tax=unclassified Lysinibacillus TaxID=2636778 RepID=UPI000D527E31|nr:MULTISPECIES: TetR/AcrR family transcriptional regulator [unclassified Lysinibacillus]AWE07538.1 TetR/AcrR family transcriptional regulator [Lysinibacillus sp. 2017]TGN36701.1 TetR/AcrR family transcriptional regulator [Lysinibacillus sp. S2017]